ncbi:Membrane insertase [Trema orientale]|uniref:Membrane insertase n=1 Tax=Trema orientale TaxID=63057 RepID=A0A2P5AJ61_TREOI|nr:Membrane insertase [Trema orientale]
MASNYKILNRLRRSVPATYLSTLSHAREYHLLPNPIPNPNPTTVINPFPPFSSRHGRFDFPSRSSYTLLGGPGLFNSRTISTRSEDGSEFGEATGFGIDAITESPELITESNVVDAALAINGEESILPFRMVISMLDGFHELSGLPWWVVIGSSILALRLVLFPLLIYQLHKLKRIGELFNKLPPPLPEPFSGKSYIDHILCYRKERKAIGCPSFLWFLPYVCVQVPCFFLWMTSIRRMSLDHHPGFDCGGAFWFQNLTEFPHGVLGSIFPVVIAGLHYANVQYYKHYLDFLTLPILLSCYYVPQGTLVYWVTNSSLTAIQFFDIVYCRMTLQQLSLQHPDVRSKLGLPDVVTPSSTADSDISTLAITPSSEPEKLQKVSLEDLSPKELLDLSVQLSSEQHIERAIPLMQLALSKDPEYTQGLIFMGQILMQKGLHTEAIEYLERAISKLLLAGHPTEVEDIDHLILASLWAGSLYTRQGKLEEGLVHFERIGSLKEPEHPVSKAHYFDGLLSLSSALHNVGCREEAAYYLRLAVAYNPAFNKYWEQFENDDDSLLGDLANSRRHDY